MLNLKKKPESRNELELKEKEKDENNNNYKTNSTNSNSSENQAKPLNLKPLSIEEQVKQTIERLKKKKEEEESKKVMSTTKFAGEEFQYEKEITEKEQKALEKSKTNTHLDNIVNCLQKKKEINIFDKTRVDWDSFVSKNNLSKELDYARKDGYLAKKRFIEQANYNLIQQKKQEEQKHKSLLSMKNKKV